MNVMKHYGMLAGKAQFPESWNVIKGVNIYAKMSGLLRLEPDLRPRERVEQGATLSRIIDYFGKEVEKIRAPCDGIIMGYRTDLCVYPGDLLLKVGRVLRKDTEYPCQRA